MRRTLLIAAAVLVATATAALAAPQKGKPPKTGPGCKPQVAVILKGTVAVAPGSAATLPFSLQLDVTHANLFGKKANITAGVRGKGSHLSRADGRALPTRERGIDWFNPSQVLRHRGK